MNIVIIKRGGDVEPFVKGRIALAVFRACQSEKLSGTEGRRLSGLVSEAVWSFLQESHIMRIGLEEVQDLVVAEIKKQGYENLALAYEGYREARAKERFKISQSKKNEKGFRFTLHNGKVLEIGRAQWALVLDQALKRGVGLEWSVSEWWSSCKDMAIEKKSFDDFVSVHIQALLEKAGEREHWLFTASALLMERWFIRVTGDSPLLSGEDVSLNAMKEHCRAYWMRRKSEQKCSWVPSLKELDQFIGQFKHESSVQRGFSGLLFLEKMLGFGVDALLPQEIFLNVTLALSYSNVDKALGVGSLATDLSSHFLERCINGEFIPPYALMRQSLTVNPCLVQEVSYPMPDTFEGIFEVLGKTASAAKSGASVSIDLSTLRAEGASVGVEGKISGGIEPVLRLFGEACSMVKSSVGEQQKARLSLSCWHADIERYLGFCRVAPKQVRLSICLSDVFMKKVMEDGDWLLISPHSAPHLTQKKGLELEQWIREYIQMAKFGGISGSKCVPAREVFRWITDCISASDNPSIIFGDACLSFSTGEVGGQLSARMSNISKIDQESESVEIGVFLKKGEHEENLSKLIDAHVFLNALRLNNSPDVAIFRNVAPVGLLDPDEFLALSRNLMINLEKMGIGFSYNNNSFFSQSNPWDARRRFLRNSRGGYLELEDVFMNKYDYDMKGVKKGPTNLLSYSSREEYLWLANTNSLYADHKKARRLVIFNGVRFGFGGVGIGEDTIKKQLKMAATWQSISDGPLALDVRLENLNTDSVGEAIKLAWLHGMVGIRRFIGQR